jgi:predicted nucleic acid-binding protein
MLAVADTGPLNYLCLVGVVDILPALFGRISLPEAVREELRHPRAPRAVRTWISGPPGWIDSIIAPADSDLRLPEMGVGERAVIVASLSHRADLILMDDRQGITAARALGLRTVGTIGLLDRAARRGLIDLPDAVGKLSATNFRCRPEMLDALLNEQASSRSQS